MQAKQQRDIFVSFVVAHKNDLYAIVYVRGISRFGDEYIEKVYWYSGSLQKQGKLIKFPTDKDEEHYWAQVTKNPGLKGEIDNSLERSKNYGQELSKLVWDHLLTVCHVLNLGVYKGAGAILSRENY
jgi:hypothetical protein